jgi:thiol-disulfide isomerase/thioredoxin
MVKEVMNSADFRASINVPNLVVVDYYATWCGPCTKIAPFVEQLSRRYPEVVFLKVGEHNCQVTATLLPCSFPPSSHDAQDVIMSQGVRAFPTFQFFINSQVIDEMKGANPTELESKVNQHLSKGRTSAFS